MVRGSNARILDHDSVTAQSLYRLSWYLDAGSWKGNCMDLESPQRTTA